jgi:hypothetical protein
MKLKAESQKLKAGFRADVAQLVEHSLGKGEVTGSNPVISSRNASGQWTAGSEQLAQGRGCRMGSRWQGTTDHCLLTTDH